MLSCSSNAKQFVVIQQQPERTINFYKIIHVNSVVACLYEETGEWYLAIVKEKINEDLKLSVHFFNVEIKLKYKVSARDDTALMPPRNIIKIVETLKYTTRSGRTYKMVTEERSGIENIFSKMRKKTLIKLCKSFKYKTQIYEEFTLFYTLYFINSYLRVPAKENKNKNSSEKFNIFGNFFIVAFHPITNFKRNR